MVKGHGLSHFLVASTMLSQFVTITDHDPGIMLPDYLSWEKQDQLLLLVLLDVRPHGIYGRSITPISIQLLV